MMISTARKGSTVPTILVRLFHLSALNSLKLLVAIYVFCLSGQRALELTLLLCRFTVVFMEYRYYTVSQPLTILISSSLPFLNALTLV